VSGNARSTNEPAISRTSSQVGSVGRVESVIANLTYGELASWFHLAMAPDEFAEEAADIVGRLPVRPSK